jgi:hypothetical protein
MSDNPTGVRFIELRKICEFFFGKPRLDGSSHYVFKTPWPGNPRINIQDKKGMAQPYQVRQVLKAIELLKVNDDF